MLVKHALLQVRSRDTENINKCRSSPLTRRAGGAYTHGILIILAAERSLQGPGFVNDGRLAP
jgi:hypothetical protein